MNEPTKEDIAAERITDEALVKVAEWLCETRNQDPSDVLQLRHDGTTLTVLDFYKKQIRDSAQERIALDMYLRLSGLET